MKKWLVDFTEKDFSHLPKIVGVSAFVLAIGAVAAMIGITWGVNELGLGEIIPVWILQIAVMSPWAAFIGLIIAAIVACVALMVFDMAVHKNHDEYKNALQFWKNDNVDEELSSEIFGHQN